MKTKATNRSKTTLTRPRARQLLESQGVELGPLQPRQHPEALAVLPSAYASSLPETAWQEENLAKILQSARVAGENALNDLSTLELLLQQIQENSRERIAAASRIASGPSVTRLLVETLPRIAPAQQQVQGAWDSLLKIMLQALTQGQVGATVVAALDEYYAWQSELYELFKRKLELEKLRRESEADEQGSEVESQPDVMAMAAYPVATSQEWLALMHSASDGSKRRYFVPNEQAGTLRHQRPDAPFFTETVLSDEERRSNLGVEILKQAAEALDVDDCFIWLYVSNVLAPIEPVTPRAYAGGWVDLDDVARKTLGGYAPNPAEAERRRRKVWHAIRYGARAHVGGKRTVPYFDKNTGKEIETEIYTTPWQIVTRQQPVQASLFSEEEYENVPVTVELVASREWTRLTTSPNTAQFLPLGELLGAIPPGQAGGAWARALGLAYFYWCRSHVQPALRGDAPPSRAKLLEQFPPKIAPHDELLNSNDPGRALKYWKNAEDYLRDAGFIDAPPSPLKPAKRKGWKTSWLEESPDWKPGPNLVPLLEKLAMNVFPSAPRELSKPRRKTRKKPKTDS